MGIDSMEAYGCINVFHTSIGRFKRIVKNDPIIETGIITAIPSRIAVRYRLLATASLELKLI